MADEENQGEGPVASPSYAEDFVLAGLAKAKAAVDALPFRSLPSWEDLWAAVEATLRHVVAPDAKPDEKPAPTED